MNKKCTKYIISPFEYGLILAVITVISFLINIVLGIIVAIFAFISYRKFTKNISALEKDSEEVPVYEDTRKFIDTLVSEQEVLTPKPLDNLTYPIKKGTLPTHVHETLDEMGITTWGQLALYDEKELLFQKCFGEKALNKIKAELGKRGLALNSLEAKGE